MTLAKKIEIGPVFGRGLFAGEEYYSLQSLRYPEDQDASLGPLRPAFKQRGRGIKVSFRLEQNRKQRTN